MDTLLVDGEGQLACSRRESRLAFQATRKVKTILVTENFRCLFFVGTTIGDAVWPRGQTTYRKKGMANK